MLVKELRALLEELNPKMEVFVHLNEIGRPEESDYARICDIQIESIEIFDGDGIQTGKEKLVAVIK